MLGGRKYMAAGRSKGPAEAGDLSWMRHARRQLDLLRHWNRTDITARFSCAVMMLSNINALWNEALRNIDAPRKTVIPLAARLNRPLLIGERPSKNATAQHRRGQHLLHFEPSLLRFSHG